MKKGKLILLVAGFVLLMVCAGVMYGALAGNVDTNQISVTDQTGEIRTEKAETNQETAVESQATGKETASETQGTDTTSTTADTQFAEANDGSETAEQSAERDVPKAPDFTVYDAEGNAVHLSDFAGKRVIVNFWASWCGPCKSEMPDFNEKYLEIGEEIQFMMVNLTDGSRETVETASAFVSEQGYVFPFYYDTDLNGADTYGVYSIPCTYFINEEGYCVAQATGAIDMETLEKGISYFDK